MERILMEPSNTNMSNRFVVNWCMGNRCHYRCSYCSPALNSGDREWTDLKTVQSFTWKLMEHLKKNKIGKKIVFELTGGEITLHTDLRRILGFLKNSGCETCVLSNGAGSVGFWDEMKSVLDYCILSFHADHCRSRHFFEVIQSLKNKMKLNINIMMHPGKFELCENIGKEIIGRYPEIPVSYQPLYTNLACPHDLAEYSDAQMRRFEVLQSRVAPRNLELMRNRYRSLMRVFFSDGTKREYQPEEFILEKSNNWNGWLCWAGCEQIVISQDGDVFRAWCCQDWIGNVNNSSIRFPKHPTVCEKNACHCNTDISTRKQKIFRVPRPVKVSPNSQGADR